MISRHELINRLYASKKPFVVIEVSGGVALMSNYAGYINVVIWDHDNQEAEGEPYSPDYLLDPKLRNELFGE